MFYETQGLSRFSGKLTFHLHPKHLNRIHLPSQLLPLKNIIGHGDGIHEPITCDIGRARELLVRECNTVHTL